MIEEKLISKADLTGDCRFCKVPDKERVLAYTENFYIMLSLGPIVEGYILVVSKEHVDCIADLKSDHAEEFVKIYHILKKIHESLYGVSLAYEHGQAGVCSSYSSNTKHCHHAHLHMLPSDTDISGIFRLSERARILLGWNNFFGEYQESPCFYLMCTNDGNYISYLPVFDEIPRQYLRKVVASHHNEGGMWDWLNYPQWTTINSGEDKLRERIREELSQAGLLKC